MTETKSRSVLGHLSQESQQKIFDTLRARIEKAILNNEELRWDSLLSKGCNGFLNFATNHTYQGLTNCLMLALTAMIFDGDPRFGTYLQIKNMSPKAYIKAGEHLTPIFIPLICEVEKEKEDGTTTMQTILRGFKVAYVANARQTNLIELNILPASIGENVNKDSAPIDSVVEFFSHIEFKKATSNHCPFYRPGDDTVGMPDFLRFHNNVVHAEDLCHEMVHWTGASQRLNRNLKNWQNIKEYSREELVACLGSAFLLSHLGVELGDAQLDNQAAYLKNWMKYLSQEDGIETLIVAASDAQKAVSYLIRLSDEGLRQKEGERIEESVVA